MRGVFSSMSILPKVHDSICNVVVVDCIEFGRRLECDGAKAIVVEEKSAMAAEADATRLLMIVVWL